LHKWLSQVPANPATWVDARSIEKQGRAQVMNSAAKVDFPARHGRETGHDGKIWFTFSIRKFQRFGGHRCGPGRSNGRRCLMRGAARSRSGRRPRPAGQRRRANSQHAHASKPEKSLPIDYQAVDPQADRSHRRGVGHPHGGDVGLVDADGWKGRPSAR